MRVAGPGSISSRDRAAARPLLRLHPRDPTFQRFPDQQMLAASSIGADFPGHVLRTLLNHCVLSAKRMRNHFNGDLKKEKTG